MNDDNEPHTPAEGGSTLNKFIVDYDVPMDPDQDYDWNFLCTPRVPCSEAKQVRSCPWASPVSPDHRFAQTGRAVFVEIVRGYMFCTRTLLSRLGPRSKSLALEVTKTHYVPDPNIHTTAHF
jgi:hypothetical protein